MNSNIIKLDEKRQIAASLIADRDDPLSGEQKAELIALAYEAATTAIANLYLLGKREHLNTITLTAFSAAQSLKEEGLMNKPASPRSPTLLPSHDRQLAGATGSNDPTRSPRHFYFDLTIGRQG